MRARRAFLFWLIVFGCVLGLLTRFAASRASPQREPRLDFLERADISGKSVGSFDVAGPVREERFTLRLRSPRCERPIVVAAGHVERASPEETNASRFPATAWRTVYVYDGHAYDSFSRLSAYLHFVARRLLAQLTLSPLDLSDLVVFTFHAPKNCPLDGASVVAASKALIALAPSPAN